MILLNFALVWPRRAKAFEASGNTAAAAQLLNDVDRFTSHAAASGRCSSSSRPVGADGEFMRLTSMKHPGLESLARSHTMNWSMAVPGRWDAHLLPNCHCLKALDWLDLVDLAQ